MFNDKFDPHKNGMDPLMRLLQFMQTLMIVCVLCVLVFLPMFFIDNEPFRKGEHFGIFMFALMILMAFACFIKSLFSKEEWDDMIDEARKEAEEELKKLEDENNNNNNKDKEQL